MILVDTSVWIDHFQRGNRTLVQILEAGEAAVHPMILGELACGNLTNRHTTLHLLTNLPSVPAVDDDLVLHAVETRHWFGRGIGWIDAHLLAACILANSRLFTLDVRLRRIADAAGCGFTA